MKKTKISILIALAALAVAMVYVAQSVKVDEKQGVEIRKALPVEVRKALPVEIRKAVPVEEDLPIVDGEPVIHVGDILYRHGEPYLVTRVFLDATSGLWCDAEVKLVTL
jgi:hypothetical protein